MAEAEARLQRFAPYIASVFPEIKGAKGIIESPLVEIRHMQRYLENTYDTEIEGRAFAVKM